MIVERKSMTAVEAEDFNQINLNNINLNITTTTAGTKSTVVTTAATTTTTKEQHTQGKSMAQSTFNNRRQTALPHSMIMNQQNLLHTQQQQQQQQQQHTTIDKLYDLEYRPILRKSLSTPAFNDFEQQNSLKSEITYISNHNQPRQEPDHQQQQQYHHCQVHLNNMNSSCSTTTTINCNTISTTTAKTLDTTTIITTPDSSSSLDTAATTTTATTTSTTSTALNQRLGCAHYKRRAMFVTPCCHKFYKCRFCHDENESHQFDRKTLTELICSECNTRQKVQERCQSCGIRFGKYTCLICNLFDDANKRQYHCDQCGICRIGGRENFFHCKVCNMCLPIQLKINGHRCVENISRSHCPVCLGDIHTSRIPCHIPDCGHLLHKMCFDQLLTSGHYTCPTCQTSLIDMTALWEYLDIQAEFMPIPKKYENERIHIFCNDCHKTSKTRFHFIGLKCLNCGAYNTTQEVKRRMSLVTDEPTSA